MGTNFLLKKSHRSEIFWSIKFSKLAPTYSPTCVVPSVVEDFTSVFGMRTGVPLPPKHQLRKFNNFIFNFTSIA